MFSSVGVGFGRDIHRRILTAAQLLISRPPSSFHTCISQLDILARFEEGVSQSGHRGGVAFWYGGSKEIFGNRGDCDSSRPWHEDKDRMTLLMLNWCIWLFAFLRECFPKIGEQCSNASICGSLVRLLRKPVEKVKYF